MSKNIIILGKILKSLGIQDYQNMSSFIYKNYDYNHFITMCSNYNSSQIGGYKIKIDFEGIEFEFSKYKDEQYTMFALTTLNNIDCILIRINKKEQSAEILGLGYYPICFTNKQIKHFKGKTSGSLLLKLALKLIEKIKDHYKIKKITLQDNSKKKCNGFDIELSSMYILMYGETWYGKYGFIPYIPSKDIVDEKNLELYLNNKKRMNKIKVKDVPQLKKYIRESYNNIIKNNKEVDLKDILLTQQEISKMYKKYKEENKLLKDFISEFLIKYDKSCLIFYSFYDILFTDLHLHNFYGKSYVKFI